jgi:DNA-binding transcriptional ArsR family regulator
MLAIANCDRLAMLETILVHSCEGGCGVMELADAAGISRFAASHHLGVLRDAGLLESNRRGGRILHQLVTSAFELIEDWVIDFTDGGPEVAKRA